MEYIKGILEITMGHRGKRKWNQVVGVPQKERLHMPTLYIVTSVLHPLQQMALISFCIKASTKVLLKSSGHIFRRFFVGQSGEKTNVE